MQVFNAYYKVIRKHIFAIMVYFAAFIVVSVIISASVVGQTDSVFTPNKTRIAVFNEDSDAVLTEGIVDYLNANARVVQLKDEPESIQDALFYGDEIGRASCRERVYVLV
jgi:ABC-2 type transport system permease protein